MHQPLFAHAEPPVLAETAATCPALEHRGSRPGDGTLVAVRSGAMTALVGCRSTSPLRLFAPRPRSAAAWVVAASHGGGLVDGDAVDLRIEVGAGATLLVGTQAETKVFRCPERGARQTTAARVGAGGLLALLPDPVSPYAGARFVQTQRVDLGEAGSLLLLDAVTAGRVARGERWALARHEARIEVTAGGRLVLADAIRLVAAEGPPLAERLAGVELLATVLLLGPRLAPFSAALLDGIGRAPALRDAPVLAAASPIAGGALLRIAARSVEEGQRAIHEHLAFVPRLLGEDPFARRP